MGRAYGVTRVPVVKNQAIPAYDPRAIKGIGITYATSTQGADHTMGYTIATNILGVGGKVDPLSKEGQVELSRATCRSPPRPSTPPACVCSSPSRPWTTPPACRP